MRVREGEAGILVFLRYLYYQKVIKVAQQAAIPATDVQKSLRVIHSNK